MKKKKMGKAWICVGSMLVLLLCSMPVSANGNEDSTFESEIEMVETAGMNGYYTYNAITKEKTYTSPSEYEPNESELGEIRTTTPDPADPDVLANNYTEYYENGDTPVEGTTIDFDFLPDVEPYGIVDGDNRFPVSSVTSRYASTCLLVTRFENGEKAFGTGFLVDNYHVLTAAHNVLNVENGYASHVAVYAGSNNGTYKKYSLSHTWDIGGHYEQYYDTDYGNKAMFDDWAILECDSSMAGVGAMSVMEANNASEMTSYKYYTQGYPYDRNRTIFGNFDENTVLINYYMFWTYGYVIDDEPGPSTRFLDVVSMTLDTYEGQSGSPIYRLVNNVPHAQAIVVAGSETLNHNYALLINDWLFNVIENQL